MLINSYREWLQIQRELCLADLNTFESVPAITISDDIGLSATM